MKTKRSNRFINALNTAATHAINSVSGVWQEIQLAEGEKELRYRLCEYGNYPGTDALNGQPITQIVDREAGETMAANFNSLGHKIALFFKGTPIYEGHADDAEWLKKNPGHKASAVGRIKAIECEDDGIYVTSVLNSDGVALLSGDAPKYSGHSPFWRLVPVAGKPAHFRPVLLWSDALTNNPNIMTSTIALNALGLGEMPDVQTSPESQAEPGETENQDTDMQLTPEALAALGFAPDATPSNDEISAAIVQMSGANETAEADKAGADTALNAANSRATLLDTELKLVRETAVTTVLGAAVADGRITEADKPAWTNALNTSFATEAEKLARLMPVLNTANRLANQNLGERKNESPLGEGIDAMNTAVSDIATANRLDLAVRADYDKAHAMARAAKPELFKR